MPQIKMISVTFDLIVHIEIGELEVFLDISISPFNIAFVSSKYMAILAASDVTLTTCAIQTTNKILANDYCWF